MSDSVKKEVTCELSGYREGFYYGGIKQKEINASVIRGLSSLGKNYPSAMELMCVIEPGTEKIVFAFPEDEIGPVSVYNVFANTEMLVGDNFVETRIDVPGANGFSPITYKVLSYEPAYPYENSANLKVVLGG